MKYVALLLILVASSCGQLPADDATTSTETTRAPSPPSTETTPPPPKPPPEPDTEEQLKTLESPSTTTRRSYPTTTGATLPSPPPLMLCGVIDGRNNAAYFLEIRATPSMPSDVKEFLERDQIDVWSICDTVAPVFDVRVDAYSPNGSPCASVEREGLKMNIMFTASPPLKAITAGLCPVLAQRWDARILIDIADAKVTIARAQAELAKIALQKAIAEAEILKNKTTECLVTGDFFTRCHNPYEMP